jgi:hypothetical protein
VYRTARYYGQGPLIAVYGFRIVQNRSAEPLRLFGAKAADRDLERATPETHGPGLQVSPANSESAPMAATVGTDGRPGGAI